MVDNKKISSYLLYAVGEVFLVVVGILIAVQIGNFNKQKEMDLKAETLLLQIQDEALLGVKDIENLLNRYYFKDSLHDVVLADTLTVEDYLKPESTDLRKLVYTRNFFSYQKEGFDSYMSQIDLFSPKYQSLSKELKAVYLGPEIYLERNFTIIEEIVKKNRETARRQSWLTSIFTRNFTWNSSVVDPSFAYYLAHDSTYKSEIFYYSLIRDQLSAVLWALQSDLVNLYKKIDQTLDHPRPLPPTIKNYYVDWPPSDKNQLVGTYLGPKESFEITLVNNQLFWNDRPLKILNNNRLLIKFEGIASKLTYSPSQRKLCYQNLYKKTCYDKQ